MRKKDLIVQDLHMSYTKSQTSHLIDKFNHERKDTYWKESIWAEKVKVLW